MKRKWILYSIAIAGLAIVAFLQFSQSFDFVAWLDASENDMKAISQDDREIRELLERYQPRVYVSKTVTILWTSMKKYFRTRH